MLQMNQKALEAYSAENIQNLVDRIAPILEYRREMYKRYSRKNGLYEIIGDDGQKKTVPFEYYIANMVTGYLSGKAPQYNVRCRNCGEDGAHDEVYIREFKSTIDHIRRYNDDGATYMELVRDYVIMSGAYLYVYENSDNEIVYTRFDSKQTVGIWDYSTPVNLVGLVRMWAEEDSDGNPQSVIELLTKSGTRTFRSSSDGYKEKAGDNGSALWDGIPAVAFENPDNIAIFEPGLSDIKDFEQIRKNIRSMTQENDEAKLLLRGYNYENQATILNEQGEVVPNPARLVEEQAILNARTISVDDDGDIHWLLKDVNYSGLLDVLKSLHDEITMLTGVPNMTDEAFANADNASALGYKLYALDQYTASMDRIFRKGYLALWELICGRLAKKGRKFDFRDIDVVMQRNIPTDKDKSINRAATMKTSGLFSDETCISESQVEVDPAEEIAKRDAEAAANYELAVERAKELGNGDDAPGQDDDKTDEDGDLNGTARP